MSGGGGNILGGRCPGEASVLGANVRGWGEASDRNPLISVVVSLIFHQIYCKLLVFNILITNMYSPWGTFELLQRANPTTTCNSTVQVTSDLFSLGNLWAEHLAWINNGLHSSGAGFLSHTKGMIRQVPLIGNLCKKNLVH